MKLVVVDDYEALSRAGAEMLARWVAEKPDAAMVLATGDTPMGVYKELALRYARGDLDTSRLQAFQLDEYLGVPPDDRRSLYGWLLRSFIEPLGIDEGRVVAAWTRPRQRDAEHLAHAAAASRGGFDIAVLGLGPNGHLGFNEPPSEADAPTRAVELTEASVASNARYWGGTDTVPRRAVTAGMAQLLASKRVLLVVSGAHKQEILQRAVQGPATSQVPASLLQRAADVTVLADRAAWPH